jgi:hypothetical protein
MSSISFSGFDVSIRGERATSTGASVLFFLNRVRRAHGKIIKSF